MAVTIYHNPRCSKSRQTLALLNERGLEIDIVEYLKTPPDAATLAGLLVGLGLERNPAAPPLARQGRSLSLTAIRRPAELYPASGS